MFRIILRLLTLRITREEMLQFNRKHLLIGVIGTWIVGIGRYWDDETASTLQHLGLGSVIYIFLLALFIWLIVLPFRVENWRYFTVLTFISLTSFPAIFYAIPVERFYSLETANTINAWFLGIVALWRLCMLFHFLEAFTRLSVGNIVTITFMPICLIITTLTILNVHRVVFDIMGGRHNTSPHEGAYAVLMLLTLFSSILIVPLLMSYGWGIYKRHKQIKNDEPFDEGMTLW